MIRLLLALVALSVAGATTFNIVWDGSSSTWGTGFRGQTETTLTGLGHTVQGTNSAASGQNMGVYSGGCSGTMVCEAPSDVDPILNAYPGVQILWIQNPTNDIIANNTGEEGYSRLQDYLARRSGAWHARLTMTITPRTGGSPDHTTAESRRQTYNTLVRNGCAGTAIYTNASGGVVYRCSSSWFAHYLIDAAADSRIGDEGDQDDTTYYQVDAIHLNTSNGSPIVADLIVHALTVISGKGLYMLPNPLVR